MTRSPRISLKFYLHNDYIHIWQLLIHVAVRKRLAMLGILLLNVSRIQKMLFLTYSSLPWTTCEVDLACVTSGSGHDNSAFKIIMLKEVKDTSLSLIKSWVYLFLPAPLGAPIFLHRDCQNFISRTAGDKRAQFISAGIEDPRRTIRGSLVLSPQRQDSITFARDTRRSSVGITARGFSHCFLNKTPLRVNATMF